MKFFSFLVMCCVWIGSPPATADEGAWTEDAAVAINAAKEERKDLLLLYTASDWCPPCQKLEQEILGKEDFLVEISKHYVLVKFDFPKQSVQDPEIAKQNQEWAERFGVSDYPTVVLVDPELKPFGITGYQPGGVGQYLEMLHEFKQSRVKRDEALTKARTATGDERAVLLDEAMSAIDQEIASVYYEDIINEIVELDKEDDLGLRTKWNEFKDSEMRKMMMTDIFVRSRLEKPDRAIAFIDEVLKEISFPAEQKLQILQIKLNLLRDTNELDGMDRLLDEMINMEGVAGDTRQRLIVKKTFLMVGTGRKEQGLQLLERSLAADENQLYLWVARGELLDRDGEYHQAIAAYDRAIPSARHAPDLLIELVSAKADAHVALTEVELAMRVLDDFAEDQQMPSDLRGEALLHKAMIMRQSDRRRQARLAENRAVEIAETPAERAEMQKLVDRLRKKYGD